MNDIRIRLAGKDDLKALFRLYFEFHEFHVRGVPDRLRSLGDPGKYDCSDLNSKLEKIIESKDSVIFVAEIDKKLVGLAEVYIKEDKPDPQRVCRRYGYMQSLVVTEKSRDQGIGRMLVRASEGWVKQNDGVEMRLDIWEFTEGPLEFYQQIGYRTLRRTLVRKI